MPYTDSQNRATYKYIEKNREQVRAYDANWKLEKRNKDRDSYNEYQLNLYHRKRANDYEVNARIFRRILA